MVRLWGKPFYTEEHSSLLSCAQATLPSPSHHLAARLSMQNVPKVPFLALGLAHTIRSLSRALLRLPYHKQGWAQG